MSARPVGPGMSHVTRIDASGCITSAAEPSLHLKTTPQPHPGPRT
jgi:hypothetical protein